MHISSPAPTTLRSASQIMTKIQFSAEQESTPNDLSKEEKYILQTIYQTKGEGWISKSDLYNKLDALIPQKQLVKALGGWVPYPKEVNIIGRRGSYQHGSLINKGYLQMQGDFAKYRLTYEGKYWAPALQESAPDKTTQAIAALSDTDRQVMSLIGKALSNKSFLSKLIPLERNAVYKTDIKERLKDTSMTWDDAKTSMEKLQDLGLIEMRYSPHFVAVKKLGNRYLKGDLG